MADNIELVHAGLPWNNPQKITVKADQYISQLVINRGLLNLLSNDYYLDLKTQRINQYIVDNIGPHLTSPHFTQEEIGKIIKKSLNGELGDYIQGIGLSDDSAFIIPFKDGEEWSKCINRIQNIINNCPKNLNGHTVLFVLTPVVANTETITYNGTISDYISNPKTVDYTGNVKILTYNKAITFNNFYGGTIVFMGNPFFTCEQQYLNKGLRLSSRQTRTLIQQIQKQIDQNTTPHITIEGSGQNTSCSVVAFNNCNCDTYMWNLNITINTGKEFKNNSTALNDANLPYKKNLALFFPADVKDDQLEGTNRFITTDAINEENFTQTYITLRSQTKNMIGDSEILTKTNQILSSVCLSGDYLELNEGYTNFIQTLFGAYMSEDGYKVNAQYEGATLCFWMKDDYKDINDVPILYSVDANNNGFYIGLEKVASIINNKFDLTQYVETSFASKKRDILNNNWIFWSISVKHVSGSQYAFNIKYADLENKSVNSILPSKLTKESSTSNTISLPYVNLFYPVKFFGTPTINSKANIRNILLFNQALTDNEIQGLVGSEIEEVYNFQQTELEQSFKNGMKGAVYVYNTNSMNIMGCELTKVQ